MPDPRPVTSETTNEVSLSLMVEEPVRGPDWLPPPCAAPIGADSLVVPLARPLAGRALLGAASAVPSLRSGSIVWAGGHATSVVPRLLGFDLHDAQQALSVLGLTGSLESRTRGHGLVRVVAQTPGPGVARHPGMTVRLRLTGR
jgi:hypothetical protein